MKLSASIVLYQTNLTPLKKVIDSYFACKSEALQLFLIDNSPTDVLKSVVTMYPDKEIHYIFNNENMGYGKAHNIAIKKSMEQGLPYHIVLNPDIVIQEGALEKLTFYMNEHPEVGNIMPKIIYPNGQLQYLCKLLPSPIDLIFRRFIPFKKWRDKINQKYELHSFRYNKKINIPNLSGCFMFLRTKALEKVGLFDENIFMYLEDIDLNRRIHRDYKTIFFPEAVVVHEYQKASYKNIKLLKAHIKSAIYYFNKYGWFFDKERRIINAQTLQEIEK
ncbi:glycosyltransferase family 2 protein [Capnocytophaga sputigena]|uniref:glycosyltransferase family 2 protein n=1 Tax=Capnocytophaga sputigena TaxID=1019 RepID=UPI0028E693B3|nr:glycosyltransferase family 2 protein [Capnocytophaga sputigena]